jgi:hypothetical protein
MTNGFTARAWLHMLREGGRWTAAELCEAVDTRDSDASVYLKAMVAANSCRRHDKTEAKGSRVQFSVGPECTIPRGVTIGDVIACELPQ